MFIKKVTYTFTFLPLPFYLYPAGRLFVLFLLKFIHVDFFMACVFMGPQVAVDWRAAGGGMDGDDLFVSQRERASNLLFSQRILVCPFLGIVYPGAAKDITLQHGANPPLA